MATERSAIVIKLQLISSLAADAANNLQDGKYWEGDLSNSVHQIAGIANEIRQLLNQDSNQHLR